MTYRDRIHPWCIIRLLPKAQRITVARFRRRNDADNHAQALRRLIPAGVFIILFEPPAKITADGRAQSASVTHTRIATFHARLPPWLTRPLSQTRPESSLPRGDADPPST